MVIKVNKRIHPNKKIKRLNLKESKIPKIVKNEIEFFVSIETLDFFENILLGHRISFKRPIKLE
jgi:hypothetical protein